LEGYAAARENRSDAARNYLKLIELREQFPGVSIFLGTDVIKQWGYIFAFSLLFLFLPEKWEPAKPISLVVAIVLGLYTAYALHQSRRFMQASLNRKGFAEYV
jgi:hypothetical protein